MSKRKKVIGLGMLVLLVVGTIGGAWWFFGRGKAGLLIEAVPDAQVYVDGEYIGKTPYDGVFEKKEITLKLVPESFETPLVPYEIQIMLTSGVKTVIRRGFGQNVGDSFGEEISFERLGGTGASVAVISEPDGAQVYLNGGLVDVTPVKLANVTVGVHQLTIRADGHSDRSFSVQALAGFGVTASVQLQKNGEITEDDVEGLRDEKIDSEENDFAEILETPIGYLRVRQGPSVDSAEIGRVEPGEKHEIVEKSEDGDWIKINLKEAQKSGWVFGEYVSLGEVDDTAVENPNNDSNPN